jgi:hypothetical protein
MAEVLVQDTREIRTIINIQQRDFHTFPATVPTQPV